MSKKSIFFSGLALLALTACTTVSHDPYTGEQQINQTTIGAGVGTVGGAIIGALAGDTKGAIIGATVGGISGAAIGNNIDRQEAELRATLKGTGVQVAKVGNDLRLVIPSDITFKTDSANINAQFYPILNSVALVLKKYRTTEVIVAGHTDNTGKKAYNQRLSEKRASSVSAYLHGQGIHSGRLASEGYGMDRPIASNNSPTGRSKNRRVELRLHTVG